jgi:glucosyl-3-phosphoglycerate phosphatase
VVSGLNNCHWSLLREHGERWVLEEHNAGSLPQEVVGDEA